MRPQRFTWSLVFSFAAAAVYAQQQPPPRVVSPEVHSGGRVTFRLRAPGADQVAVAIETLPNPTPLAKDAEGVWRVTVGPLEPDFYAYTFQVDGARVLDPVNRMLRPNLLDPSSTVHVPGPGSLPWEINDVPRGVVHRHFYRSGVVGDDRDYFVYTPPRYDPRARRTYPVLYLLHGYSDEASMWVVVGRANVILDNLIAQGKATPMLVVMPLGYGAPEIVAPTAVAPSVFRDEALRRRHYEKFRDALLQEVIPAVERDYRVAGNRNSRAIAGLSMGGAETLFVALNNMDRFAWIGAFSSGGLGESFEKQFPALDARANSQLRLLWVSCGKDDFLIEPNRKLRDWLQSKGIEFKWLETEGAHTWQVWRRNLAEFAQLLFR
jgi:enterochelin esterase-like enzyme